MRQRIACAVLPCVIVGVLETRRVDSASETRLANAQTSGAVRLLRWPTPLGDWKAPTIHGVAVRPDADTAYAGNAAAAQGPPTLGPLEPGERVSYFIDDGTQGSQYRPSDRQLAVWALQAWERSANGALRFESASEAAALVRVHWVPAGAGQYGEMRSLVVNGRRGAAVYVRPDTDALGPDIGQLAREDPVFRDTIVYLTCLHELGHALGLGHTAEYRDIMYFFGYGGDIPGFFKRYRAQLRSRDDIARVSGLSPDDVSRVRALYSPR
jgi:hypothetical protein